MGAGKQEKSADQAGWAALREGRWQQAHDHFQRAVADDPSPESLEGLSWAAWWLDDAEGVFEARERAFAAYRDSGDAASAARVATWLGSDQLDFNGALATASGWLERAQRLLDPLPPGPDHGWLSFHRAYVDSLRGDSRGAERGATTAASIGREAGVVDLEMLGLSLQGMTLVSRGEVAEGMRRLDEASAMALAGEGAIPISRAWTCCFLVTACTRVLDFERAFEWCDRIADFAERYGSRYMLGFCRAEHATIHMWRGHWEQAERALEESLAALSSSRPAMVGGPLVGLAELRRRQGRVDECRELLERAGSSGAAQLCHGRLALDAGDARRALELGERVRRSVDDDRRIQRVPSLQLIARAQVAIGALDDALATQRELAALTGGVGTPGLDACRLALEGLVTTARGEPDRARALLEDAIDAYERCGAEFDGACTRIELAAALEALERHDDARREARLAHERLDAMGAAVAAAGARRWLEPGQPSRSVPADTAISPREAEVLGMLTEGLKNREIAQRLHISEHTVHRHVNAILRKLDVPSRTAAAALALRKGLVGER